VDRRIAACAVACLLAGCGASDPGPQAGEERALTRLELAGKRIFNDASLSEPPGQACASCHDPAAGFAGNFGGRDGVPLAADRVSAGLRNTPTAAYASFTPPFTLWREGDRWLARGGQFLDGRAASLEEQALAPFFAAGEMNLAGPAELAMRLQRAEYASLLVEEFGPELFAHPARVQQAVAAAIAAFERSAELSPFSSKLDHAAAGRAQLSLAESEGMRLFLDPAAGGCARCHAFEPGSSDPARRLFTDFGYHALGVPRNAAIPDNADPSFFDLGLCGPRRASVEVQGLCGAFKTPTLRNVARRVAFMHNGRFRTLRDAVAFHATRDSQPARWYGAGLPYDDLPATYRANVAPLATGLDEAGIDAVVAFLRTLDDGYRPR
jgi:cytochrome c peroxidase